MSRLVVDDDVVESIATLDDLRRIVADVRTDRRPRLVRLEGGEEVTIAPAPGRRPVAGDDGRQGGGDADDAELVSAGGSWSGLFDPEEFKRRIREERGSDASSSEAGSAHTGE